MEYTDEVKAIASKLARIDSAISTLEEQRKAEVQRLIELGCTGQHVPSTSGEIEVCLTCGYETKLNEEKARELFPDEYAYLLKKKQEAVKLNYTDVKKSNRVSWTILDEASDKVYATVRATVKHL